MFFIKLRKFFYSFERNLSIAALISSILSVFLGIAINSLGSNIMIPLRFFVIYFIISLFIFWAMTLKLIDLYKKKTSLANIELLSFNTINENFSCILKPCILDTNSLLTIFYIEKNVEMYIATAKVKHTQSNGYVQAELIDVIAETSLTKQMHDNDSLFLRNLTIKPIVTDVILKKE